MILHEYDYEVGNGVNLEMLTEDDISRLFVDSSNIKSFWYIEGVNKKGKPTKRDQKAKTGILTVEFLSGGIYEYYDVPANLAEMFTRAPSFGRFLWRNVRGRFDYKRVDPRKAKSDYRKWYDDTASHSRLTRRGGKR